MHFAIQSIDVLSDIIFEIGLFSFIESHITFESKLNVGTEDDIIMGHSYKEVVYAN